MSARTETPAVMLVGNRPTSAAMTAILDGKLLRARDPGAFLQAVFEAKSWGEACSTSGGMGWGDVLEEFMWRYGVVPKSATRGVAFADAASSNWHVVASEARTIMEAFQ